MVLTYKRNLKKGFYGYTDEINKCSNYRVNTPNGFVFLSSKNDGEKDAVKLINFNMKKITNKDYFLSNCNGYNEIYKILTTDVKKYFGDSLDTVDYTFQ